MSIWKFVLLLGSALSLTDFDSVSCMSSECGTGNPIDGECIALAQSAAKINDYPDLQSSTDAITVEMKAVVIQYIQDDWKILAGKLGLNSKEIQYINDKHDSMSHCAEEMLEMWLSKQQQTLGELVTALGKIWRTDINDKLGACL